MSNPAVQNLADLDPNKVAPGLLGFLIVCVLGVATWFLVKSMSRHLSKLEADYPDETAEPADVEPKLNGAH
jgi:hypothetical protein